MTKSNYHNYTKEQLIAKLEQLEKKRYGLVWEDKKEDIAEQCEKELPVLVEDKQKEIITDPNKQTHFIFEGDNYHTLYTLNFTHKKKIDVIYIDPPYNTGNKSWIYNNNYVDKDDRFRHSKWLSFMYKRLKLSKRLLKDGGIIVCAIDDYEMAGLKLVMDKIFGEQNRLSTCVVVHNPGGRQDEHFFPTSHEYMLIYSKNISATKISTLGITEEKKEQYKQSDIYGNYKLRGYRRSGSNSRKEDRPNLYYPIYYNKKNNELSLIKKEGSEEILPIDNNGIKRCWRWNSTTFMKKKEKYIEVKQYNGITTLYVKEREDDNKGEKPKSIWSKPKYTAVRGTATIKKIFETPEKTFNYPKSPYLILDILKVLSSKNATILYFFAGSGTTGQAVLELNKEDGGNRQAILCTNNENKICEEVTYPRVKKVITGYADVEGIPANVKYFKTDFVPFVLTDNDKRTLVFKSTELLCIAENTFEVVKQNKKKLDFAIFKNHKKYTAIIYDEDSIENCCKKLNEIKTNSKIVIYVFSYDHTYEDSDFIELKGNFIVKPIPEAIINVYRKISKLRNK